MERPFSNLLPGVPHVESPFCSKLLDQLDLDAETRRVATDLHERGYAVIDFPEPDFDRVAEAVKASLHGRYDWQEWRDHGHAAGAGLRIQDAWSFEPGVERIAGNPRVIELLSTLYGRRAWPFQTLSFPVGTQQHYHSDSVHFSSVPERFMCGVWVALEDVDEDAGPLVYYPGSHRWPIFTNEHIGLCAAEMDHFASQSVYEPLWAGLVEAHAARPERFVARKGQALIWAANLLHGGERHEDTSKTRWSQVTHYFFEDCVYYCPMLSDPFYGSIELLELEDLRTGQRVAHRYAGREVRRSFLDAVRRPPPKLPAGFDARLYLQANPDVARAGMDAAEHYLSYGKREGRKLRP